MDVFSRTARETLRLPSETTDWAAAPWAVFDPDWYRNRYPDAPGVSDGGLLEWHLASGQTSGHSPNRFFDVEWQRRAWFGIQTLIDAGSALSAFDTWCRGAHASRPPHWLFDPSSYSRRYPVLTGEVLAETELPAGAVMYASPASANRDPRRWGDDADHVRVDRGDASQHLQFGAGVHACLGSHLARLQAEIAFSAILDRLDDLELAGTPEWGNRMFIRGLTALPVACTIRARDS